MLLIGCLLSLFVDRAKWTRLTRAVALVPCKKVGFLCIHLSLGWAVITAVRSTRLRRVSHWLNGRNIENCSPVFTCVRDGRKGAGERPPLDNWRATTATGRWPAAMVEKVVIHHGSSSRRSTRVMACVPHFEPMGERLVGGPLTHSSWPLFSSTCCSSWASSLPPWAAFWWNQGRPTEWPTAFLVCVSSVCVCVCVWHWQSLSDRPPVRKCPSLGQLRRACWCWLPVCWLVVFWLSTLRAVDSAPSGHSPFVGCVRLHCPVRDGVVLSYDYLVWWWAAYQLNVLTMQVLHSDDMRLVKPRQPVSFDFIQSRWASGRIFIQIANCRIVPLHDRWFAVADSSEIDTTHFWHPTDWLEKMWIKDGAGRFLGGKQWSSTCCCSLRADGLRHFIFFHTHLVRRPVLHLFRRLWCVSVACGSHLNETIGRWGAPSISGHRDASDRIPHSPRPTFA